MLNYLRNHLYPYADYLFSLLKNNKDEIERRKVFYNNVVGHDDLVFDVGANMGNRVGPLVGLGAKVVAVEPQSRCNRFLKLKFGNKIEVVKKGVSSKIEVKTLYLSKAHIVSTFSTDWMNSWEESGRFKGISWNRTVDIEMTTLDELIKIYGIPSFIKIDIEGYEFEALKGLTHPVANLSFEYAVPEHLNQVLNCLLQLELIYDHAEYNYSVGESMEWVSDKWMNYDEMLKHVQSTAFSDTRFGDIYIRKV